MIKVRINNLPDKKVAIAEILIQPGDYINENQAVALIKYQNKTIPIISPTSGQIKKVYLKLNKNLKIGKKIIKIDETVTRKVGTSIFANKWTEIEDENFDFNNIEKNKNNLEIQKQPINLNTITNNKSNNPVIDQKIKDLQEKIGGVSKYRQKINEKINKISNVKTESENNPTDEKQLTFRKIINQRVNEVKNKNNNNIDYTSEKQVNEMKKNNANDLNNSQLNEEQLIKRKDIAIGEPRPMSYAERVFARAEAFEKAKINNNKNLVLSGEVLNRINSLPVDENPNLNNIVNNLTNDKINNNLINEQYMQNNSINSNYQPQQVDENLSTTNNNNLQNLNNLPQILQNQNLLQQQQLQQQLLNLQNQQMLTNPLLMPLYPQLAVQQQLQQQLMLNQMLNNFNPMLNNLYLWNLPNMPQMLMPNLNNLPQQIAQPQQPQQSQIYQVQHDNGNDNNLKNILNHLNNQNKNSNLNQQKSNNPIVTSLTNEVDLTSILKLRERLIATGGKEYARLSYIIFIIKAVSSTLKQYPQLNAIYNQETGQVIIKNYHNISLTTTTGEGIKNPVINSVNQLSIKQLSHNLENILMRVKTKQANSSYFEGSTISITNFGSHRVVSGVAPIQTNHVAAIAIGKVEKRPVVIGDKLLIRHLCYISITIDQRAIDNSLAGNFLETLKESLEKPDIITFAG